MPLWIAFVLGTALCWGAYGPTFHAGQMGFTDAVKSNNAMRAFLCVGAAYFLLAVLVPVGMLGKGGALGGFTMKGTSLSLLAGTLGAVGALCVSFAFKNGGNPIVVMPLVFGGAPIVNFLVSVSTHRPEGGWKAIDFRLYAGLALVAVGAYLVLRYKPS